MKQKKALGKTLPDIIDEQQHGKHPLVDTRYCFDKNGRECEPPEYKEGDVVHVSSFVGKGIDMVVTRTNSGLELVPETAAQRVKRLNNQLQGCF